MTSFKEFLKIDDEAKKTVIICLGLAILVVIHALDLLIAYWAIQYSNLDAFVIAVIMMAFGDMIAIGIVIIKAVFKISPIDMDKIRIDDAPK